MCRILIYETYNAMIQNQFRRQKGKSLTKRKALNGNVNSLNVPTLLVVYFFALVFLCTLCPCISVNRINTCRLVISLQYVLCYTLSYVFIIKVQNIYYGNYREAFCVLANLVRIDYVPKCKNYRQGRCRQIHMYVSKNNIRRQIFFSMMRKVQRYPLKVKHENNNHSCQSFNTVI